MQLIDCHLGDAKGLVLDLGCGPGHLSGHLASRGVTVTGIDLAPEFIEHARMTQQDAIFEVGSLTRLSQADGTVAGALAWYSLIHLDPEELAVALREIRRVLEAGSVLVLGFFEGPRLETFDHKVFTAYRWPVDGMVRCLATAGFREAERLLRPREGARRPHAALAAHAI